MLVGKRPGLDDDCAMKDEASGGLPSRIFTALLSVAASLAFSGCTDRISWSENVQFDDNVTIVVAHESSRNASMSFGHAGQIGSGENTVSAFTFEWNGQRCAWKVRGDERPIVLRLGHGVPWLITFDRTKQDQIGFRFYRFDHDGTGIEVEAGDFPKGLAVQNMWLREQNGFRAGKPINEFEIATKLDPASVDFRRSLTAKLWRTLETGGVYSATEEVDLEFLAAYRAKYIAPAADPKLSQ